MQFVLGGLESRVLVFYTMLHALNPQSLERICYLQNIGFVVLLNKAQEDAVAENSEHCSYFPENQYRTCKKLQRTHGVGPDP